MRFGVWKMKLVKRIPFQMFVLNLVASMVCIMGMLIMRYNLNEISHNYEEKIEKNLRDRLGMSDVCRLMSRHHIVVSMHALADSTEAKISYEASAKQIREEILDRLGEMKEGILDSEKDQLFHTVYSNAISYFSDADNVFQMSRDGSSATAQYYITSYLAGFIDEITDDIDVMDGYVAAEMQDTQWKMEQCITMVETSERVCIVCICLVMAVCSVMCISITSRLEKYKNQLEEDNECKTRALFEHNRKMLAIQENTIIGMANLIENRDHDTGEHVKRTSRYVELLTQAAQRTGYCANVLTYDYAELLVKAAPMHDIGKIAVSDMILQKPGRLTEEEFETMKSHTTAGGRIIVEVLEGIEEKEYVDIAAQIAQGHHEKWDGTGYPDGLKGEEIPLCARIMAVADVFDALVSKRCYKDPMPIDKAFDIIRESGGSHFDPELAKLFCSIRSEVEKVLEA